MGNRWIPISIIFLSISILISSIYLGSILKAEQKIDYIPTEINNAKNDDMLSIKEAASFLDISEVQLRKLVERAELYSNDTGIPHYSIENEIRFSKKSLNDWLVTISKFKLDI